MRAPIVERLLDLNRQFYQTFGAEFSATRLRLQPGVRRLVEQIPSEGDVLDLGCGNGELARQLARRGHSGQYSGLDFSPALLQAAQATSLPDNFRFFQADLAATGWDACLPLAVYPLGLAFALFHHLPSHALRLRVLHNIRQRLTSSGRLMLSVWQFLDSPRLRARLQPWESVGLCAGDVEPGDYLLDWRRGGVGLRYVHAFDEASLAALAEASGFSVVESFRSDGENGRLGLYQVWQSNSIEMA